MTRSAKLKIWVAAFVFTVGVALAFQLVFLPYIAPNWHAGDGLMIGGDWLEYHSRALDLVERIRADGWGEWELRYHGFPMSGILAAVYVTTLPEPWVFTPIAAALHATVFLLVALIMWRFLNNIRGAIIAALPFLLFPTSLLWTTQPLKDGFSVCGFILIVFGAMLLARLRRGPAAWKMSSAALACLLSGSALVWLVRPYLLYAIEAIGMLVAVVSAFRVLALADWRRTPVRVRAAFGVSVAIALAFPILLLQTGGSRGLWETPQPDYSEMVNPEEWVAPQPDYSGIVNSEEWETTPWLPGTIDRYVAGIAAQRDKSIREGLGSGSAIDTDVSFSNAVQVIAYIPRAVVISLLAPLPAMWFSPGDGSSATFMRSAVSLEMLLAYVSLPFLLFGIWRWRRLPELWLVLTSCAMMLVVQPLFVANLGSIVRLRYPYFTMIVCLGAAAFVTVAPGVGRRLRELMTRKQYHGHR